MPMRSAASMKSSVSGWRPETGHARTIGTNGASSGGGSFGISVLGADHGEVAALGAASGAAKFVDGYCDECDLQVTSPRVRGAVYHLDCRLAAAHEHGDHTVIVGAVVSAERTAAEPAADPLIYFDRSYRRVGADLTAVGA
jgi:flavin reductase (DIM6/NTAB) family NADH-FMN oxidoreductase RutF